MNNIDQVKEEICNLLRSSGRVGVEDLIDKLNSIGFFTAPASSRYHSAYEGGLAEHSLNVYIQAKVLNESQKVLYPHLKNQLKDEELLIASILHDVCKSDIYKKVKKWRKDENNKWEQYDAYEVDQSEFPMGHGEKSVIRILNWGFKLTDEEIIAIRWHMGAWDLSNYSDAQKSYNEAMNHPLAVIIQVADTLATRLGEVR